MLYNLSIHTTDEILKRVNSGCLNFKKYRFGTTSIDRTLRFNFTAYSGVTSKRHLQY